MYLADLLELVKPKKGARHVTFEGADKLPNGFYGTSCASSLTLKAMLLIERSGNPFSTLDSEAKVI